MVRQPAEAGEVQRGQSREGKRGFRLTFDAGLSHKDLLPLRGFPRCTPCTARRPRLVGGNFRACVHALRTGTDTFPALPFRPPTQNYDTTYVGLLVRPAISRASLTQSVVRPEGTLARWILLGKPTAYFSHHFCPEGQETATDGLFPASFRRSNCSYSQFR